MRRLAQLASLAAEIVGRATRAHPALDGAAVLALLGDAADLGSHAMLFAQPSQSQ